MTNKKKVLHLIMIYILIIQTFLLCDLTLFDSVFSRDFKQNFLREEMSYREADKIVGVSLKNVGSGMEIYEYNLPFGKHLYVTAEFHGKPCISIRSDFYLFKGALLPIITVLVAVLLVTWYCLREKRRAATEQASGEAKLVTKEQKVLNLIILYVAIIEAFIVCDLFLMNGVFCRDFLQNFINSKMRMADVFKILGESRLLSTIPTKWMYTLPFGKEIYFISGGGNGLGIHPDSYFLRGAWIPAIMVAVAVAEFACYRHYEKRKKRLKSDPSPMDATE